jgi:Fic family protein
MYKYSISPQLLKNIKTIAIKINELNFYSHSKVVLTELEASAVAISTFSSTSIEGNPLPLTEVKKILKTRPKNIRASEKEVLNYNDALLSLNKKINTGALEFNLHLLLSIQKEITQGLLPKHQVGKWRKEPFFVNDPKLRKTIYWPPDHQDVETLLEELVSFIADQTESLDALILAGLFHKQFVIIHPFVDGNGRTVRLATKVLLAKMGLNIFHLFSFENYYNRQVSKYFEKVGVRGNYYDLVKQIDFTSWLEYFTDGILDELMRVEKELQTLERTPSTTLSKDQEKIISYLEKHSFIKDSDYARLTKRAKATRSLDFKKLILLGKIEKMSQGPATYYQLIKK